MIYTNKADFRFAGKFRCNMDVNGLCENNSMYLISHCGNYTFQVPLTNQKHMVYMDSVVSLMHRYI